MVMPVAREKPRRRIRERHRESRSIASFPSGLD
jgi:hypothetical protein